LLPPVLYKVQNEGYTDFAKAISVTSLYSRRPDLGNPLRSETGDGWFRRVSWSGEVSQVFSCPAPILLYHISMIIKTSSSGQTAIVIDDDGRMYSFHRKKLIEFLNGETDYPFFFGTRMATERGFLESSQFDTSMVYFLDEDEKMEYEEAVEKLGGEEIVQDGLKNAPEMRERINKQNKYKDSDL